MRRRDLSTEVVVQALEQTLSQVHVADGVDGLGNGDRPGVLAEVVAPMMLDALEMPLVDQHHYLLALGLIDLLEEILVSLVHKDLLQLREEDVGALNVPVNEVLIQALLGEALDSGLRNLLSVAHSLLNPRGHVVLEAAPDIVPHVNAGLMVQSLLSDHVHLLTEEL